MRSVEFVLENTNAGKVWMSDSKIDQYVPDQLSQEWRELVGYDSSIGITWHKSTSKLEQKDIRGM